MNLEKSFLQADAWALCRKEPRGKFIGVPKESKDKEYRVAITPDGTRALRQAGHQVLIQATAGEESGFAGEEYRDAGATNPT